ncbi:Uncharacterised protein [Legionella busanensis]|uniref:Uncharacterized protein n=1 Tax=Legionella busanensis TaxID=190655 RepID=A0A378JSZ8_9GAMM|nr:hypothetical protein [Legionella busanensis]STX51292.1 Uncharacterised protein [Legionella busanensis]
MKFEFFTKEKMDKNFNKDHFFYLPIVEVLHTEKWYLANTKNIYKHFYTSPDKLMSGERLYINKCLNLSCYKVNLTAEQAAQVEKGTKILNGYRAAVSVAPWQVECRIEFNQFGNIVHQNADYFKNNSNESNVDSNYAV